MCFEVWFAKLRKITKAPDGYPAKALLSPCGGRSRAMLL